MPLTRPEHDHCLQFMENNPDFALDEAYRLGWEARGKAAVTACRKRSQDLADSYCHTESDTNATFWTNNEAEWVAIELDELADEIERDGRSGETG